MKISFNGAEMIVARSALNVMIDAYRLMSARAVMEWDRDLMIAAAKVGEMMLVRFRSEKDMRSDGGADLDFEKAEITLIERALRMSAAKWQQMITPGMGEEQKAFHFADRDAADALMMRLRQAKGLPW